MNNVLVIGAIAIGGIAAWFLLGKPTSIEGIQAGISGITDQISHANYTVSRGGGYGGGMSVTGPGFVYQHGGGPGGGVSMHGIPPPGFGGGIPYTPVPIAAPYPIDSIRGGNFAAPPLLGGGGEYGLEGKIGQSPYANPLPSMGDGLALGPFLGGIGTSPFVPGQPFPGSIGASPYPGYGFPSPGYPGIGPTVPYGLPPPLYGGHLRHGGYEFGGRMRGQYPFPDPYSHPYGFLGGYPPPPPDFDDFRRPAYPGVFRPGPRRFHGGGDRDFGHGFGGGDHDEGHHEGGGFLGNIFGGLFGRH